MELNQYLTNLQPPNKRVDVILDTDAYNEIDDQYAISLMLKSPERFNVKAIVAAPFFNNGSTGPNDGMEKSFAEIHNLLSLMKSDFKSVYRGSTAFLSDETTPVISEGANEIVKIAQNYSPQNPLYIVAIGAITNVASALLIAPEIAQNIVVVWLGGHAVDWVKNDEFNCRQDVASARVVFKSACPLVLLPCCGVVDKVTTTKYELEYWLKGKNELCDYLVNHTISEAESYAKGKPWSRVIWDITAVLWFFSDQKVMQSRLIPCPVPEYDHLWAQNPNGKLIDYVYTINRDKAFEILFSVLSK
ncbi:MAG: nucleoside hydrolase [Clostridia bacterium]|nr:nucleoside hydrolase [Clostridia bacterium]